MTPPATTPSNELTAASVPTTIEALDLRTALMRLRTGAAGGLGDAEQVAQRLAGDESWKVLSGTPILDDDEQTHEQAGRGATQLQRNI